MTNHLDRDRALFLIGFLQSSEGFNGECAINEGCKIPDTIYDPAKELEKLEETYDINLERVLEPLFQQAKEYVGGDKGSAMAQDTGGSYEQQTPKLTRRQAAVITAVTGVLCGCIRDFHKLAEEKLGRSVFTSELKKDSVAEALKDAAMPEFLRMEPGEEDY